MAGTQLDKFPYSDLGSLDISPLSVINTLPTPPPKYFAKSGG